MRLIGAYDFLGTASSHGEMFLVSARNSLCTAPSLLAFNSVGCSWSVRAISLARRPPQGGIFMVGACDFHYTAP